MKHILVTGANGQLGQCLKVLAQSSEHSFTFLNSKELDVTNPNQITSVFKTQSYDFCINCAAYTAVDKAESEVNQAQGINAQGAKNLAEACKTFNTVLIHISTDFVFDGTKHISYIETDATNPLSVYGQTKLEAEQYIQEILERYYIIRTSWLYSEFGKNFVKRMLHLARNRDELNIVDNQIGTPTYAMDLAKVILKMIPTEVYYGLYHFSNQGVASWYDFAKVIFELTQTTIKVNPIPASSYPTPAERPHFSVLNKAKIVQNFNLEIPYWQESLKKCIKALF